MDFSEQIPVKYKLHDSPGRQPSIFDNVQQAQHRQPDKQMAEDGRSSSECKLADDSKDGLMSSPSSAEASRQSKKRTRSAHKSSGFSVLDKHHMKSWNDL